MYARILLITVISLILSLAGCWESGPLFGTDGGPDGDSDSDADGDADSDVDTDVGVSGVTVEVHDKVNTILVVSWNQVNEFDEVWLKYTFENDEWYESPARAGDAGEHEEVVLGIPGNTDVTIRIVVKSGDTEIESEDFSGTTDAVPSGVPIPTIESYDSSIATSHRWLLGAVEATPGDGQNYSGPFWLYIIDRQGRILWYHSDLGDNPILTNVRVSRDNKYIFFANRRPWGGNYGFSPKVTKMTLDWSSYEEIELDLSDNADMTDDGKILYNSDGHYGGGAWLKEWSPDGTIRNIWDCNAFMGWECYSNTVNWNPLDDTVLLSFPYSNTVVEIDRQNGNLVGVYGEHSGSYDFDPSSWDFGFQHYAVITDEGTLMVSSHMPGSNSNHGFLEFEIDRDNEVLEEKWYYDGGNEWPGSMGEAYKIKDGGGNVLGNYGEGGVIKEITQGKEVAWQVKFDAPWSNDENNKMVGHNTLIDDLYTLCEGF